MKKLLFIVNPCAGKRRVKKYMADILGIFNRAGYRVEVHMTAARGDAIGVVQERARDVDLIVCAGGDGTLNEAITGLLRGGLDVPIGYIPCGSTNDFANSLNLPTDILQAARLTVEGQPVRYDVGRFGGRYFSYVASFGAFTRASYATPQGIKNALGHTAYVLAGARELTQIRKLHIRLEADGQVIEDDFIFGAISNSTSVGGIMTLDPGQVDMRDGKFEVMLIRAPRSAGELASCINAIRTQKYNCAMMTFFSAKNITVQADPDMNWTLDGEREDGHSQVQIDNLHHAIAFMK